MRRWGIPAAVPLGVVKVGQEIALKLVIALAAEPVMGLLLDANLKIEVIKKKYTGREEA
jgi:hypothetical protein